MCVCVCKNTPLSKMHIHRNNYDLFYEVFRNEKVNMQLQICCNFNTAISSKEIHSKESIPSQSLKGKEFYACVHVKDIRCIYILCSVIRTYQYYFWYYRIRLVNVLIFVAFFFL